MKMTNEHNEEVRDLREKLHRQNSEIKEFMLDEDFAKSESLKEIKVS